MARRRTIHLLFILLASVSLEGCAIHARPLPQPVIPPVAQVVKVFYATDRERVPASERKCDAASLGNDFPEYAGRRARDEQLAFGEYSVRIPLEHRIGQALPNPSRLHCVSAPDERMAFVSGEAMSHEKFFDSLSSRLKTAERKEIFVLVHGYDARFDEGLLWTAQLKSDLEFPGIGVLYSWPSLGRGLRYSADQGNAEWSAPHLKAFLSELSARCPGAAIHLIAHSLGNQILLEALNLLAKEQTAGAPPHFGQVIFAAPDVDAEEFRKLIEPALHLAQRMTLYVSSRDSTLVLAGRIHHAPRAGDSAHDLVILPGLDTVDISSVEQHGSAHTYLFENRAVLADISRILRDAAPPAERFGLNSTPLPGGVLWRMRP